MSTTDPNDQTGEAHAVFMRRCLELALAARQRGDSPVGAVIVRDGEIIGEGIEGGRSFRDITFHAEIEAIRRAREGLSSGDLSGCILYTTHEPCIMCSYVIRHHAIHTVVFGLATGEIGGCSSALPVLQDGSVERWGPPPVVIQGVLEQECRELGKSDRHA